MRAEKAVMRHALEVPARSLLLQPHNRSRCRSGLLHARTKVANHGIEAVDS